MIQDFRKVVGTDSRTTLLETECSFSRPNQLAKTSGPTWAFKRALTRSKSALCIMSPFSPAVPSDCFYRDLTCILPILEYNRRRHRITKHIAAFQYHSATPSLLPASAFMFVSRGPFQRHAAQFKRSPYRKRNPHPPLRARFSCKSVWPKAKRMSPCTASFHVSGQASYPARFRPLSRPAFPTLVTRRAGQLPTMRPHPHFGHRPGAARQNRGGALSGVSKPLSRAATRSRRASFRANMLHS